MSRLLTNRRATHRPCVSLPAILTRVVVGVPGPFPSDDRPGGALGSPGPRRSARTKAKAAMGS
eukprot:5952115-Prorocentrum_lima.AAC.1